MTGLWRLLRELFGAPPAPRPEGTAEYAKLHRHGHREADDPSDPDDPGPPPAHPHDHVHHP